MGMLCPLQEINHVMQKCAVVPKRQGCVYNCLSDGQQRVVIYMDWDVSVCLMQVHFGYVGSTHH